MYLGDAEDTASAFGHEDDVELCGGGGGRGSGGGGGGGPSIAGLVAAGNSSATANDKAHFANPVYESMYSTAGAGGIGSHGGGGGPAGLAGPAEEKRVLLQHTQDDMTMGNDLL